MVFFPKTSRTGGIALAVQSWLQNHRIAALPLSLASGLREVKVAIRLSASRRWPGNLLDEESQERELKGLGCLPQGSLPLVAPQDSSTVDLFGSSKLRIRGFKNAAQNVLPWGTEGFLLSPPPNTHFCCSLRSTGDYLVNRNLEFCEHPPVDSLSPWRASTALNQELFVF